MRARERSRACGGSGSATSRQASATMMARRPLRGARVRQCRGTVLTASARAASLDAASLDAVRPSKTVLPQQPAATQARYKCCCRNGTTQLSYTMRARAGVVLVAPHARASALPEPRPPPVVPLRSRAAVCRARARQ